jgi:nitrogen fixation protein NifU and related proteins
MNNLYAEHIIDLYKDPPNRGELPSADIMNSGVNLTCGDHVRIYIKVDKGGQVVDSRFEGEGCAISVVAAALVTEEIKGKKLKEVFAIKKDDIFELLGTELGPSRLKCGMLAVDTMKEGIKRHLDSGSELK